MPYTPNWNTNNIVWSTTRVGGVNGWQVGVEVIPYEGGWDDNKNYVYFRTYFRSKTSLSFYSNVSFVETVTNDNDDEILFQYSVSNQGDGRGNNIASSNDSVYVIHSADPVEIPPTFDEAFFTVAVTMTVDDGDYIGTATSSETDSCEFLIKRLILSPNNCTYTIVGDGVRLWYDTGYDYIQNTPFTITIIPNQYYNFSQFEIYASSLGSYPESSVSVYDNPFVCNGLMGFQPSGGDTYPIRIILDTYPNQYKITANSGAYPYNYNNAWYGQWEKESNFVFSRLCYYNSGVGLYNLKNILSRGSELKGWYDDPVLESGHSIPSAMPPYAITAYAHYYPSATLTINYNKRDGVTDTQEMLWSQQVNVPSTNPTWENHSFIGWTTSSSALNNQYSAQQINDGDYPTCIGSDGIIKNARTEAVNTTIYAVWQVDYTAPQIVNPTAIRADANGQPDDDGTWAFVEFDAQGYRDTTNYGYPIINATVTIAGSSATWNDSGGGSTGSTWTHVGHHFTVLYQPSLGGQPAMSTDQPYVVTITVGTAWTDYGALDPPASTTNSDAIVPVAFYTMDFLEGGRSMAIGTSAEQDGTVLAEHPNGLLRVAMDLELFDASTDSYYQIMPKIDVLYSTPLYYFGGSDIDGTIDTVPYDPDRQGLPYNQLDLPIVDGSGNPNYDFLIVCFKCGSSGTYDLTNARLTQIITVPEIPQWNTSSQISGGTKCHEFIYTYPAANPSWYIDVSWGFLDATHIYAHRRTYSNLAYWNIDKIYGVKL